MKLNEIKATVKSGEKPMVSTLSQYRIQLVSFLKHIKPARDSTHTAAWFQLHINISRQKTKISDMAYNIGVEVLTLESVYLNIKFISGPKNTKYCLGEGFYLLFFFPSNPCGWVYSVEWITNEDHLCSFHTVVYGFLSYMLSANSWTSVQNKRKI